MTMLVGGRRQARLDWRPQHDNGLLTVSKVRQISPAARWPSATGRKFGFTRAVKTWRVVLPCFVLLLAVLGCATIYAWKGIERTDLSRVETGASRQTVESILGEPVSVVTEDGYTVAVHRYNRGKAPPCPIDDPNRQSCVMIPLAELGGYWMFYEPWFLIDFPIEYEKQRGWLSVIYGSSGRVITYTFASDSESAVGNARRKIIQEPDELKRLLDEYRERLAERQAQRWREAQLPLDAERGDPNAQYILAERSEAQAERWKWMCRAAHGGDSRAQHWMAARYRAGVLEPKVRDDVQAHLWYSLAASNGDAAAERALIALAEEMTAEQITEAERLHTQWKPSPGACWQGPIKAARE